MTHADVAYALHYAHHQCAYLGARPTNPQPMGTTIYRPPYQSGTIGTTTKVGVHKGYLIVSCVAPTGLVVAVAAVPPRR